MTDPQLGRFSLTSAFELEIREQDSWRPLTLEQLTRTLTERSEFLQSEDLPKSSEMADAGCSIDSMTSIFHTAARPGWAKSQDTSGA